METFIPAIDIHISFKKYRQTLTYDEKFDYAMETKRMYMGKKTKEKLAKQPRQSEYLRNRYYKTKQHEKSNISNAIDDNACALVPNTYCD